MITETSQRITCFISTKSEILCDHAVLARGRRVPARARPPRSPRITEVNGIHPMGAELSALT
jgi:hypothetical protein